MVLKCNELEIQAGHEEGIVGPGSQRVTLGAKTRPGLGTPTPAQPAPGRCRRSPRTAALQSPARCGPACSG